MSARSAQRTRWRRWRMGRDIAGGKDREGRLSGLAGTSCRRRRGGASPSSSSFFPPFALRRVEVLPTLLFPILSVSTACIGFRFGSAASFHFPDHVGLGFRTSDWRQQQNKPLPGLLMKQISLFTLIFEQRNGLISDSSNILTPSSRYTRHNPHPRSS